jgi:KDO2-lipid IV(A) lauroyltransferase
MSALVFSSGIFQFLLENVFRYRRKVILQNLGNSFPEKSPEEIHCIMHAFYRNLADIIVEVMKLERITKEQMLDRFRFSGYEILENSLNNGRSVIIAIGHCGNWEWAGVALGLKVPVKGYAIIKPLRSKHFQTFMEKVRNRLVPGSTLPFKSSFKVMARNRKEGIVTATLIAGDQTPLKGEIHYWHLFLNQETAFFQGIEKLSQTLDMDIIFIDIQRTGRSRYTGVMHKITGDPQNMRPGEIMDNYISCLEEAIRQNPDNWLWSHRRWKHKKTE